MPESDFATVSTFGWAISITRQRQLVTCFQSYRALEGFLSFLQEFCSQAGSPCRERGAIAHFTIGLDVFDIG